jgi:hypothetical protein
MQVSITIRGIRSSQVLNYLQPTDTVSFTDLDLRQQEDYF